MSKNNEWLITQEIYTSNLDITLFLWDDPVLENNILLQNNIRTILQLYILATAVNLPQVDKELGVFFTHRRSQTVSL